ncbi:Acetyltransferase (GNAT) family protein [Alloyangia pacifica]|uniref:Acetyltransferase (GNAT) family protein n=1 Tax=Alloyangia pacifica TaxID=311180 RepID=A0A1I6P1I5_9RHOB|nr:Acetyltransferase (GNAT) family protein [Alloyangia pacifica]SFS34076.1 Acetyltransferase (GNAT) family protein [Alloyangia pacifica]
MPTVAEITIRTAASPDDFAAVRRLCLAYREDLRSHHPAAPALVDLFYPDPAYSDLLDALPGKHDAVLLADLGGAPVGCAMSQRLPDGSTEIKRVYVAPEARGHGLAGLLVEELATRARAVGVPQMRLDTMKTLGAACHLYAKLGFVERGPYQPIPEQALPHLRFFERRP